MKFSFDVPLALSLVCVVSLSGVALAQPPADPNADPTAAPVERNIEAGTGGDAARREARVRFQMGVTLFEEGDFQGALAEFERANASSPSHIVLYNIAQTNLALRDYVAAVDALTRYLELAGTRATPERRAEVERQLETLNRRIGRVRIICNEDGATVTVDGRPAGRTPLDGPIRLSTGRHQIVLRVPDRDPHEEVLTVAGNTDLDVTVEFPPPPPDAVVAVEESHTLRTVGFVGMGVGAASGVTALAMLGLTVRAHSDYESATDTVPADDAQARAARDDMHRFGLAADILTGVALAAGGTGLALFMLDGRDQEDPTAVTVGLAPTPNGLTVFGRF